MKPEPRDPHDISLKRSLHDQFPTQIDQYICPQCEAEIPLAQVIIGPYADRTSRRVDKLRAQVVRRVQVQCPYCKAAYDSGQVLEFGAWHCSEIRRITCAREKADLSGKIDARLGNRQLTAA